jgi:NAD(P)-dependent dehydrogenase (short-subunit alcohol dehydrogenase family)
MVTANPDVQKAVEARHPWGALGDPNDIAEGALFLASDEAAWITGHELVM